MKLSSLQQRNSAFTLIELMIAMVVSLIIIAAIGIAFTSSQKSYRLSNGMMEVHDNGRFLTEFLRTDFQKAGWVDAKVKSLDGHSLEMPIKDLVNNKSASADFDSDQVTIRYYAKQACDGAVPVDGVIDNQYKLAIKDGVSQIQCNGIPLASNVESFQLQYGVLTQNGIEYKDGASVVDLSLIKTIRFAFLISSRNKNIISNKSSASYELLGEGPFKFSDGKYRQVFSSTVVLNNRSNLPPKSLLITE